MSRDIPMGFKVTSAVALSPTKVQLYFSKNPGPGASTYNPINYEVSGDLSAVPVLRVVPGNISNQLVLLTSPQAHATYTVFVTDVVSEDSEQIQSEPAVSFVGWPQATPFRAKALSASKVNILFDSDLASDEYLTNPSSYSIQALTGGTLRRLNATSAVSTGPRSVEVTVDDLFYPNIAYTVFVQNVTTTDGLSFPQSPAQFEWVPPTRSLSVPFRRFSGEVRSGSSDQNPDGAELFGHPNGVVFFSPSLIAGGAPNSQIQVDRVSACTQAGDTYSFPKTKDPPAFYTHGAGVVPTPAVATLNSAFVLFANFYRLGEAQHNLSLQPEDEHVPLANEEAMFKLRQVYDPARFALLNSTGWHLFDGTGNPFVVADNLSPVGSPIDQPLLHHVCPPEHLAQEVSLAPVAALQVEVAETVSVASSVGVAP
jgi:hypothetical protein